ncbi:MAG: FRG domain-containing protein [Oscillospiraceae bacterium]|jgi:transcriptional regulator with XRE-family HTH domain|nr:FRG domain-containing protein [Oscillospiraceae bacterium]
MSFTRRVHEELKEKKVSQKALADHIGISTSTLNNWFKSDRDIPNEYVVPICGFLGMDVFLALTGRSVSQSEIIGNKAAHVSSVPGYIAKTVQNGNNYFCFRGEGRDYGNETLLASAFREPYKGDTDILHKIHQNFYKRVYLQLTESEKGDFVAVARHHNLPINLLDVTKNPLIALYFACENKSENDGVVYCFSNDYVDITPLISVIGDDSPFDRSKETKNSKKILYDCFAKYFREHHSETNIRFEPLIKALSEIPPQNQADILSNIEEAHPGIYDYAKMRLNTKTTEDFLTEILGVKEELRYSTLKNLLYTPHFDRGELFFDTFLGLLNFATSEEFTNMYEEDFLPEYLGRLLNWLPLAIYNPLITTARYSAQNSCFIYQWVHNGTWQSLAPLPERTGVAEAYETLHLSVRPLDGGAYIQRIPIAAKAKTRILKELDALNINRATVYTDFDNIARYVMNEKTPTETTEEMLAELTRQNKTILEKIVGLEQQISDLKQTVEEHTQQITDLKHIS